MKNIGRIGFNIGSVALQPTRANISSTNGIGRMIQFFSVPESILMVSFTVILNHIIIAIQ